MRERPVSPPPRGRSAPPTGRSRVRLTPYQRLARTHALMAAGDAVMAVSLANSLFLDISPAAARGRVLLFLAISVAPFAIVAPLIGPAIDRMAGGRRLVVQLVALCRVVIALLMMATLDSVLLFPLAFAAMVLQKTYTVSKSALVPTVVHSDSELVEANSKLGVISGVVGFLAAVPAGLFQLVKDNLPLLLDAGIFLGAFLAATQLPREVVAASAAGSEEREELRSTAILLAASAMGLLRASVGFLFFHLAFWLRDLSTGTVWFAVGVSFAAIGTMIGNSIGPMLRRAAREELMLIGALALAAVAGLAAAITASILTALLLMAVVNLCAAVGRLGFDAIVQRHAPDANQGRAFAQFETKFQLAWVTAGIIPVLISIPGALGFAIVGALAAFAMVTYFGSMRKVRAGQPLPERIGARARRQVQRRMADRRGTPPVGSPRRWTGELPPPPIEPPPGWRGSRVPPGDARRPPRSPSGPPRRDLSRG